MLCSVRPSERLVRIKNLLTILQGNERSKQILNQFQFQFGTEPIQVSGQVLNPPELFMPGLGPFSAAKNWGAESGSRLDFKQRGGPTELLTAYVTYDPSAKDLARDYASLISQVCFLFFRLAQLVGFSEKKCTEAVNALSGPGRTKGIAY